MYDRSIEGKWQAEWKRSNTYRFDSGSHKPTYVIDTPPPYTSGVLHMGHVLSYSFIDFIARYKRMKGFNVFYPQGWDTMGFPTERAVEKKFGKDLGAQEFMEKAKELATKNMHMMSEQMERIGSSVDRELEYVTMSDKYQAAVQLSLLQMYDKGYVYKGEHPVYWCVYCRSAIAKEEVEDIEEKTKLNYVEFDIEDGSGRIAIATTRPEFIHACVAIAVNPADGKSKELLGKMIRVPLYGTIVPVIADESVEIGFGTGTEMISTFGDKQDLVLYHRHKLNKIKAVDEAGRLLNAGKNTGLKIVDAKAAVIEQLREEGRLLKQTDMDHSVKVHDRCGNKIELLESRQWFIKTVEFAEKIKELAHSIEWQPEFTKRYLLDWAEYIDWDWVISRNRRFDTPLPFWYCEKCEYVVPADRNLLPVDPKADKPPIDKCPRCGEAMRGEELTCDVWIDSSITPMVIAGWPGNMKGFEKLFPADLRVQGTEIIRSWAFYSIFRVWALTGKIPFRKILIHGMVLGPDNKKMSKSLGNVVSPEEQIEKFSVDSVRMWAALSGAIGRDRAFVFNDVKYAHDFINKLFNSFAFVEKAIDGKVHVMANKDRLGTFDLWMLSRLNAVIEKVDKSYDEFNFFVAASTLIEFFWHEFCDFYIENVKHIMYGEDMERKAAVSYVLSEVMIKTLKMLAPITPFAAEELYSKLGNGSIHMEEFPVANLTWKNEKVEEDATFLNGIIGQIRKAKAAARLALNFKVTTILINVPDKYNILLEANRRDILAISKADNMELKSSETLSVDIKV